MDLPNGEERGIYGPNSGEARIAPINSERPQEKGVLISPENRLNANGVSVAGEEGFSPEIKRNGKKIPNGKSNAEISNSTGKSGNSNSDNYGDRPTEENSNCCSVADTDGGDTNLASESSETEIVRRGEEEVTAQARGAQAAEIVRREEVAAQARGGDAGSEPPAARESNDYSPTNEATGDDTPVGAAGSKMEIKNRDMSVMIRPHSQLPKPEAPPGVSSGNRMDRSKSLPSPAQENFDMPAIGKFIREKSNSLSAAITSRLSSLKENNNNNHVVNNNNGHGDDNAKSNVTEFTLPGLRVIVKLKNGNEKEGPELKGRISFFSRSNCRDCTAVRSFLREKQLRYVEINIDVFPMREKELIERTGCSTVPQIFFNEKLFGGLVALNSLRNSGLLDQRLREMLSDSCPGDSAPSPPVYGFDDPPEVEENEKATDQMVKVVKLLRQRLPIQDRLMKMKIVKNCFSGAEMVEVLINYLDCGRKKAVEIGKHLARKHFIHHVFGEIDFEDGNHFYRFLEHEPFIPRCFNFRGSTNDNEPKPAVMVSQRLTKIMSAILESYASDDRQHINYVGISNSEEFRRYLNLVQDLHRVNLFELSENDKLVFFLNLYNAMVIHAVIRVGHPGSTLTDRRSFYSNFLYLVGGHSYSLTIIKNGILRSNRRAPYSLAKPFGAKDQRLELAFPKVNPLIHFGLCNGTRSSPTVRFFTPQAVESELRNATRVFFQRNGMEVDLAKRTVYLTRIMKLFDVDFGTEKEILKWVVNYLDATKAGLLTHLLGDGGPVNIVYQNFDWSVNS